MPSVCPLWVKLCRADAVAPWPLFPQLQTLSDPRSAARGQKHPWCHSFDNLVGTQVERRREGDAERLGGLEIDYELELGRLQHWHICGLFALEDAADIDARLPVRFKTVIP